MSLVLVTLVRNRSGLQPSLLRDSFYKLYPRVYRTGLLFNERFVATQCTDRRERHSELVPFILSFFNQDLDGCRNGHHGHHGPPTLQTFDIFFLPGLLSMTDATDFKAMHKI